ncbi:MAG: hypothetical protein SFZ23_13265 [Planctomycetota bacterium]|nr:hypothetical protein [Planctomycetota bacterium]
MATLVNELESVMADPVAGIRLRVNVTNPQPYENRRVLVYVVGEEGRSVVVSMTQSQALELASWFAIAASW